MTHRAARLASLAAAVVLMAPITSWRAAAQEASCDRGSGLPTGAAAIPGGRFVMGDDEGYPEEGPEREVEVGAFDIDLHEVTNDEFAAFVAATDYVTVAERMPDPADHPDIDPSRLAPGSAVFVPPSREGEGWWRFMAGASWRAPHGPGSSIDGMGDHPVVHVAYEDAAAYAAWAGRRLPSEAEWERAARGGAAGNSADWGREAAPEARWRANVWQGVFPVVNTAQDGFLETAPTACYDPNPYGLYDMVGNAWEWTADSVDGNAAVGIIKGGSFLCSEDYCARYRPASRQPFERDFSASHIGFRTVGD